MTTGNPLTEPPRTPIPDAMGSTDSEPPSAPGRLEPAPSAAAPDPTTADDINLMLTTSIERPEPDPMLGSADPLNVDFGVQLTRSRVEAHGDRSDDRSHGSIDRILGDARRPPYSWSTLLLASYSSAVTLALIWVLMTNRGFRRPDTAVPPPPAIDWGQTAAKTPATGSTRTEYRVTTLGMPLIVGDLEVTPLSVRFRDVRLLRIVNPEAGGRRRVADCLVLTLRLTNKSSDRRLTPLELATVRDSGDATDGSFIESATGERIGMFELAMESEWSIEHQSFPSVKPGKSEDVILVSEPIHDRKLASPLVWRVRIQTDAGESEEIGVRFDRQEIGESSR